MISEQTGVGQTRQSVLPGATSAPASPLLVATDTSQNRAESRRLLGGVRLSSTAALASEAAHRTRGTRSQSLG